MHDRNVLRSRSQVVGWVAVMFVFGALLVWAAIKERDAAPLGYVGVPLLFLVCIRAAIQRVRVTDNGVDIRNFFGSRFIPWEEIDRFTVGRFQLLPAVGIVVLRDGSTYHAGAIQAPNITRGRPVNGATRLVDSLNLLLAEARAKETAVTASRANP
jgi:hypothetical protein